MPLPHGTDRLETGQGRVFLVCRVTKGWHARTMRTHVTAEHPGTAVRWGDALYEVMEVDELGDGRVRYGLSVWDESHAIRLVRAYDEESEKDRGRERRDRKERSRLHVLLHLVGPLAGCLPAEVQENFEREYAVPATRLTLMSVFPLFFFGIFCVVALRVFAMGGPLLLPLPMLYVGHYVLFESALRLPVALARGRPIGTLLGHLAWHAFRFVKRLAPAKPGAIVEPPSPGLDFASPSAEREIRDAYLLREPFLSFLSVDDQLALGNVFGFDGVKWGRVTAWFVLVAIAPMFLGAVVGFLSVPEGRDVILILVTGGLSLEQVLRLRALSAGRLAPSVLRVLVRPFAARLLEAAR